MLMSVRWLWFDHRLFPFDIFSHKVSAGLLTCRRTCILYCCFHLSAGEVLMELGTAISSLKIAVSCFIFPLLLKDAVLWPNARLIVVWCFFLKNHLLFEAAFSSSKNSNRFAYSRNNLKNKINAVCTSFFVVLYEDVRDTIYPIIVKF